MFEIALDLVFGSTLITGLFWISTRIRPGRQAVSPPVTMSRHELAEEVGRMRAKLALVASNLLDLQGTEEATVAFSRIEDTTQPYDAETLTIAKAAKAAMDDLFADYVTVSSVVDKAHEALENDRLHLRSDKARDLIQGQTVRTSRNSRPVRERRLFESPETADTPGNVLATMEPRFDAVRSAIFALAEGRDPYAATSLETPSLRQSTEFRIGRT